MKKVSKMLVTVLAAFAMLVTMFAGAPVAEAAEKTTEIVVVVSGTEDLGDVILTFNDETLENAGNSGIKADNDVVEIPNYGGQKGYKMTPAGEKKFTITLKGSMAQDTWCNTQFVFLTADGSGVKGGVKVYMSTYAGSEDYKIQAADLFNNNSKLYLNVDMLKINVYPDLMYMTEDPTAITKAQAEDAVKAIGTVEYTDESKALIEAAQNAVNGYLAGGASRKEADISNIDTLKAAWAKYDELKAAAEAAAAGKLTIYVTAEDGWKDMFVYGWDGAEFGAWPGKTTTACKKNEGWFSLSFDITKATNLVFNNNTEGDSNQTVNIEGLAAGTYWITIKASVDGNKCEYDLGTHRPAFWQDEDAAEIEQVKPETKPETKPSAPTTPTTPSAPNTGDATQTALVVVMMLACVAVMFTFQKKTAK